MNCYNIFSYKLQYIPDFRYLNRFDEEVEQIKLKHSIGKRKNNRQHANREDIIKLTQLQEYEWYRTCGIGKHYVVFIKGTG